MDIHATPAGPDRARKLFEEQMRNLIVANRVRTGEARERLGAAAEAHDALEISAQASSAHEAARAEREARVRELAEAHRLERLHTPERLERAARRLLEGG